MRRLDVLKVREMLRLKGEVGLSLREIGQACQCGKSTVSEVLDRAKKAGISWPIELSDKALMSALYPPAPSQKARPVLLFFTDIMINAMYWTKTKN